MIREWHAFKRRIDQPLVFSSSADYILGWHWTREGRRLAQRRILDQLAADFASPTVWDGFSPLSVEELRAAAVQSPWIRMIFVAIDDYLERGAPNPDFL